jgi:hypothetical protein
MTVRKSKFKLIYDRRSAGQSVLMSGTHLGPTTNFSFSLKFFLDSCGVVIFLAPSLTRRRVCNLLYNSFWALPEQSLLGRSPQNSRPYFTVSSETPSTWRARSPYLYPPGTGWPRYPRALGSHFVASYDSQGSGGGILTRLHTGLILRFWRIVSTA